MRNRKRCHYLCQWNKRGTRSHICSLRSWTYSSRRTVILLSCFSQRVFCSLSNSWTFRSYLYFCKGGRRGQPRRGGRRNPCSLWTWSACGHFGRGELVDKRDRLTRCCARYICTDLLIAEIIRVRMNAQKRRGVRRIAGSVKI